MERINFSPLDFSSIPQREAAARKNWYGSLSGIAGAVGTGAEKVGGAWQRELERRNNEAWRNKQWQNTIDRQRIADERYDAELQRNLLDKARSNMAANALRKQFLAEHDYDSVAKYGPGAKFALSQIEHGTDWNDVVSGGNMLSSIITQREMIEAQRAAEAAQKEADLEEHGGQNLYSDVASSMAATGLDIGRIGDVYKGTPTEMRQGRLDQMLEYRQQLIDYMKNPANARRITDDMRRQLNDLNSAIFQWRTLMKPKTFVQY